MSAIRGSGNMDTELRMMALRCAQDGGLPRGVGAGNLAA